MKEGARHSSQLGTNECRQSLETLFWYQSSMNQRSKSLRTGTILLVVHGFLPTLPTSLLPMPLFSDSGNSIYIRTSLLPSSLDPVQRHYCVWALVAAMGCMHRSEANTCSGLFSLPVNCLLPEVLLGTFIYLCWDCSHVPLVTYRLWKAEYMFSGKPSMTFILTKANKIMLQNKSVDTGHFPFLGCFCHSRKEMISHTRGVLFVCFSAKGKIIVPWVSVT